MKRVSIGFGPKPQASNVNRNPNLTGGESFADDLLLKQGGVSSRVALLLRSAEPQPSLLDLSSHIPISFLKYKGAGMVGWFYDRWELICGFNPQRFSLWIQVPKGRMEVNLGPNRGGSTRIRGKLEVACDLLAKRFTSKKPYRRKRE